jgi:hypothetical protein
MPETLLYLYRLYIKRTLLLFSKLAGECLVDGKDFNEEAVPGEGRS